MVEALYAYIQDVPIPLPVYERIIERLEQRNIEGCLLHLCVRRPDGGLRYIDVWESEAACTRAFEEHIHPVVHGLLAEGGAPMPPEPTVERLEVLHATGDLVPRPVG